MTDAHEQVLRRRIVNNPGVCPLCAARLSEVEPKPLPTDLSEKSWVLINERYHVPGNAESVWPPQTDEHGRESACRKSTTCKRCGLVGNLRTIHLGDRRCHRCDALVHHHADACGECDAPLEGEQGQDLTRYEALSESELQTLTARIVERLREEGVHPNDEAAHSFVRQAKASDTLSRDDYKILKKAVAFGVKRAVSKTENKANSTPTPASAD